MQNLIVPTMRALLIGLLCLSLTAQASDDIPVTDRLIVQFKDTNSLGNEPISLSKLAPSGQPDGPLTVLRQTRQGSYVVRLPRAVALTEAKQLADQLALTNPEILFVEPDRIVRPFAERPNLTTQLTRPDFHYWDAALHLTQAWAITQGAPSIRIGVVDSGFTRHRSLSRTAPGYDFVAQIGESGVQDQGRDADAADSGDFVTANDLAPGGILAGRQGCEVGASSWHGTSVAGLIAGDRDDALGVTGVMQHGVVTPLRALWKCGGYLSDVVDALLWAAGVTVPGVPSNPAPVQVINVSLGYAGACSQFEASAFKQIDEKGVTVVVAAGNDGGDSMNIAPANCPRVIAVASSDAQGDLASYSNRGVNIAIMAPGGVAGTPLQLLSDLGATSPQGDTIVHGQGTSFAASWVSGTVGLMLAVNPTLRRDGIWQMLLYSAKPNAACSGACGGGVLDIARAVKLAKDGLYYAESIFDFGVSFKVNDRFKQVAPFTNLSGAPIAIQRAALAGLDSNHFTKLADTCSGQVIADRQECEVTVALTATTVGKKDAELILLTDTPAGEVRVKISAVVQGDNAAGPQPTATSGSGGGGCAITATSRDVDVSLVLLMIFLLRSWRRGYQQPANHR